MTCEKGCQGRAAQRSGDIPPAENCALSRQFIQVRGFDLFMPHEAIVRPRLVI